MDQKNEVHNTTQSNVSKSSKKWVLWVVVGSVFLLLGLIFIVVICFVGGMFAAFGLSRRVGNNPQSNEPPEQVIEDDLDFGDGTNPMISSDASVDDYTIMIYMIGTDLESKNVEGTLLASAAGDLREMAQCTYGDNINVLVQSGGCANWAYEFMSDGEVQRFEVLSGGDMVEQMNLGTLCMVESNTLGDYINWAAANYPAKNYAIIFWDHGGGIPVSFGSDEMFTTDMMSPTELVAGLSQSSIHFDFIGFDACLTATLEMAVAISDYADYMIGSETLEPGNGWDYSSWITAVGDNPELETGEIGKLIVNDYYDYYVGAGYPEGVNLSVIDLSKIDEVLLQYENYWNSLDTYIGEGNYSDLYTARCESVEYPHTDTVDLYNMAENTNIASTSELMSAIDKAVYYTNGNISYSHGIASYFPLGYPAEYANSARSELLAIGYSEDMVKAMDGYVSLYASFSEMSGIQYDFSNITGAQWYDNELVSQYASSGNTLLSAGGLNNDPYKLRTETSQSGQIIPVTSADWEMIQRIETQLFYQTSDKLYLCGTDDIHWLDAQGNIDANYPEFWLTVDAQTVAYDALIAYKDRQTSEWYTYGQVYATLNGDYSQMIGMIIYWSNEVEDGVIIGYCEIDSATMASDGIVHTFNEADTVEFLYPYYNANTQAVETEVLGGVHQVNSDKFIPVYGPTSNFDNLIQGTMGYSSITITDTKGQQYSTEMLPQ